ncbi:MAG: SMC family ATPase [Fimbriimonadales bacterium]|nr:SMC family ATPase [Fimbriimonadales bacterium]
MRLIALELENFRQYAHAQVAFEQGVTAIVGANGAGKTTLVEAILWALYGASAVRETTSTLRFLWSQGGAKVRVTLEFELGSRRYRIRRGLNEAELAQLNTDGAWLLLARGTSSVNERVLQLLGMNLLQFQTSFCARQKELEFMRYSKEKRREEISRMLGYERITEAFDKATVEARALQATVDGLRQAIGDPQSLEQQLQSVEAALQQTEAALRTEEADLKTATAQRDAAKQQFDAQDALREQHLRLSQQRALLENDCQHAERRLDELRTRWEELKHACERYKAIETDAKRYRDLARELEQLERLAQAEQQRAQLQAERNALQQQQAQLQAERADLEQKQAELDALQPHLQRAKELQQQLLRLRQIAQQAPERARIEAQIQSLQQQQDALQQKATARATLQQAIQEAEACFQQRQRALDETETQLRALLDDWHRQRADADAHARSLNTTLEQQRARVAQLESLGAEGSCPTCGQPLGDAYHAVLQQAQAELQATEEQLRAARQRLKQLEQEPAEAQSLRERQAQLQRERDDAQRELAQQQAQLRQLETELKQSDALEKQIRALQQQLARIPIYDPDEERRLQQELDSLQPTLQQAQLLQGELRRLSVVKQELQETAQRIAELQQRIGALPTGYDAARHDAVRTEAERLRPLYEEALQLTPVIRQRDELRQQINDAKTELGEKTRQLQQVETQIQQLGYAEDAYLQAARAFQEADERVNALERSLAARRAELKSQTDLRDHLKAQLEQIAQLQQQLREKERDLLMHQTLRKALQDFRTELNTRLRPTLASIATEFLSALTNGRYTELDIDEEYRFTVIDEGHRKAVISGGEEDIVNLSLRLALARLITERAGQPLSLLILDEVFASLDSERRQNVMELLNNLRNWFDQILVISHFEEINEAADRCVRVRRNPLTRASELVEPELPTLPLLEAEAL